MTIFNPEQIWNKCGKKKAFKKESSALEELRNIRKTGKIVPENACAYKCEICSKWHLGHRRS